MSATTKLPPETFLPTLSAGDALAAYWLRNVTLRLRREISWLWHERGVDTPAGAAWGAALPPFVDRLESALDLSRHAAEKQRFLAQDETAAYLSRLIAEPPPRVSGSPPRGSFSWVARELALTHLDCFVLALALSPVVDSAAGPVYAACLNDAARQTPTLGLAQRLWETPDSIFTLANPAHPLFTHGLITPASDDAPLHWDAPIHVSALIAERLMRPRPKVMPAAFHAVTVNAEMVPVDAAIAAARLRVLDRKRMHLVPIVAPRGLSIAGVAAALASQAELTVAEPATFQVQAWLAPACTLAWLHGVALYLPAETLLPAAHDGHTASATLPLPGLPVTLFLGVHERSLLKRLPSAHTLPAITVSASTYHQRLEWWRDNLPGGQRKNGLATAIAETARRFRYEKEKILAVCRDLNSLGRQIKADDLLHACRADLDLGDLAQPVVPRFAEADLMLPPKQSLQLREIIQAMRALTTVHYEWGTERAWNESGLTALFSGPPGTGKTMAAEVIANALCLPLYRIDLSQVVNKYIGETEKNLRRLFDAAEESDVILFFDEADALFGKRTEVKDAHDRYANLEISYLLERMERFKGLAILATNRKKDLDEAFLRRLRFLLDFPLPGLEERLRIWRQVMPPDSDVSAVDFAFLAHRFPLAGGHIRSIVFHACLQAAQPGGPRKLTMESLVGAGATGVRQIGSLDQSRAIRPLRAGGGQTLLSMAGQSIHIENLRLDLRGVPPDVAREALAALGPALTQAMSAPIAESSALPAIRLPAGADAATLRASIAGHVASAIALQINPPTD
jgi:hypothetical protein